MLSILPLWLIESTANGQSGCILGCNCSEEKTFPDNTLNFRGLLPAKCVTRSFKNTFMMTKGRIIENQVQDEKNRISG